MKNQGPELGVAGSVKKMDNRPGSQVRDIATGGCQKVLLRID